MLTRQQADSLFDLVLKYSTADETEAMITSTSYALTRFANNSIHQNMAEEGVSPWFDAPELSLTQQNHCELLFDWMERTKEWTRLVERLIDGTRNNRNYPKSRSVARGSRETR